MTNCPQSFHEYNFELPGEVDAATSRSLIDETLLQFGRWFAEQSKLWAELPKLRAITALFVKPMQSPAPKGEVTFYNIAYLWVTLLAVWTDEEIARLSVASTEERILAVELAFAVLLDHPSVKTHARGAQKDLPVLSAISEIVTAASEAS